MLELPYTEVLELWKYICVLPRNASLFSFRTMETCNTVDRGDRVVRRVAYPITNGSFIEPHMAAAALAQKFRASGKWKTLGPDEEPFDIYIYAYIYK